MNVGTSYVISRVRRLRDELVTFDVCTDTLQRASVTMRYADTSAATIDATITRALRGIDRPTKPVR